MTFLRTGPTRARALLLLALLAGSGAARRYPGPGHDLAIIGTTVIPMDRDTVLPDYTVLVRGARIVAVGPERAVSVPRGATRIDGHGRYLIPGLVDMHVHLVGEESASDLALYLGNGVTTVRNMYGEPYHVTWRDEIARGTRLGPTLYTTGPFVPGDLRPDQARGLVAEQRAAGYDFIKVHDSLSVEAYGALVRQHVLRAYRLWGTCLGVRLASRVSSAPGSGRSSMPRALCRRPSISGTQIRARSHP